MRPPSLLIALFLALAGVHPIRAGTGTGTLTAQTSVNTKCTVSTVSIAFGAYNPIGTNLTNDLFSSGQVQIACVKDTTPTIALNLGSNASGTTRRLYDPTASDYLNYEIYQAGTVAGTTCPSNSVAGLTVWGTTGANLLSPGKVSTKSSQTFYVCGVIPQAQNPSVGTSYADTIVVTVNF